jgi:hypothetical protein
MEALMPCGSLLLAEKSQDDTAVLFGDDETLTSFEADSLQPLAAQPDHRQLIVIVSPRVEVTRNGHQLLAALVPAVSRICDRRDDRRPALHRNRWAVRR